MVEWRGDLALLRGCTYLYTRVCVCVCVCMHVCVCACVCVCVGAARVFGLSARACHSQRVALQPFQTVPSGKVNGSCIVSLSCEHAFHSAGRALPAAGSLNVDWQERPPPI